MKIGYCRVSSLGQNLDRQIEILTSIGCDKIYEEKISGKHLKNRPQLEKAIKSLQSGDTFIIAEWDRATRSLYDGIDIMRRIHSLGAFIKILDKPHLDLSTALGQGFLAFLSAMAQDERERINKRSAAGRKIAKEAGVRFGRNPSLTIYQIDQVSKMKAEGMACRDIARIFNVHYSTISRVIPQLIRN